MVPSYAFYGYMSRHNIHVLVVLRPLSRCFVIALSLLGSSGCLLHQPPVSPAWFLPPSAWTISEPTRSAALPGWPGLALLGGLALGCCLVLWQLRRHGAGDALPRAWNREDLALLRTARDSLWLLASRRWRPAAQVPPVPSRSSPCSNTGRRL